MKKKLWKRSRTIRENLQRRMPRLASDYFEAGRLALGHGRTWEEMHRFRLGTKRFRYTLETFRPAYGPALEARIESLRQIQTLLGDINDCVATSEMVAADPDTESLRNRLAERAEKKTEKLRKYWTATFDAPGERERWMRYLGQYACRPRPLPRTRRLPAPAHQEIVTDTAKTV